MSPVSSSEVVIRRLYQITQDYQKGLEAQIHELLQMGLIRFNLDIAILSRIKGKEYTVEYCITPEGVELKPGDRFDFSQTYCQITCTAQRPVAIEHMGENDLYASHPAYKAFGLESYIGVPIRLNGELYGTLNFSSATPYSRNFQEIDIDALQLMASWIEVELIRRDQEQRLKELNRKLEIQACFDSLTQISNRRGMFKHVLAEINRLAREKGKGALALIDIDYFKTINDTYGHQIGDEVLFEVAQQIANPLRNYDFVARVGGEEFLLWLPDAELDDCQQICQRVMQQVATISRLPKPITVSIGICPFTFNSAEGSPNQVFDSLFEKADQALYLAKHNGRNRIEIFLNDNEPVW